jgi:putative ABC transport system ATP-binding protein
MTILQRLNQDEGITVVVVTHEPNIAAATRRVISMRDGLVAQDQPVSDSELLTATIVVRRSGP